MTLSELIEATLKNMGEDTDAETVSELGGDIASHINEAYMDMARQKFRIRKVERARPEKGEITYERLTGPVISVERVISESGASVYFFALADRLVIPSGGEGEFTVAYYTLPAPLANQEDEPALPAYAHPTLADFAAYRMLLKGGGDSRAKGQAYLAQYLSSVMDMGSAPEKISGKWGRPWR